MKRNLRKTFIVLLCAVFVFCSFPLSALAQSEDQAENEPIVQEPDQGIDDGDQNGEEPSEEEPTEQPAEDNPQVPDSSESSEEGSSEQPSVQPSEEPVNPDDSAEQSAEEIAPETAPEDAAAQANLEDIFMIARTDGAQAAALLNTVEDTAQFEAILTEILNVYFTEDLEAQKQAFLAAVDMTRAEAIVERFLAALAERQQDIGQLGYRPGEVLVVFNDSSAAAGQAFTEQYSCNITEAANEYSDINVVTIPVDETVASAVSKYSQDPAVKTVQPNYVYMLSETEVTSYEITDPGDSSCWYFNKINAGGAWNALANVPHTKVRVAVIDTGVDVTHPDLQKNLNKSLCVDATSPSFPVCRTDYEGHGTHVAGLIAATANNSIGIRGVGAGKDNSCIEIISACVAKGRYIDDAAAVRAVNWAVAKGAKVINMSFGGYYPDELLGNAVNAATNKGVTCVASAGNDSTSTTCYPADYKNTVSVIATTNYSNAKQNARAYFSNYGSTKTISAPGVDIYSTYPGGRYVYMDGTSMACPIVSGVIGMMYSVNSSLNVTKVKNIITTTATDLYTPGYDAQTGWGNINAQAAVNKAGAQVQNIRAFITRAYQKIHARTPASSEVTWWANRMLAGKETCASLVTNFYLSPEFTKRNLSDSAFLDSCYASMMNRKADASGKSFWQTRLTAGMSRKYIIQNFIGSTEFTNLCSKYSLPKGSCASTEARDKNYNVTAFVQRLYRNCLGRKADAGGLNYWCNILLNKKMSGRDVARNFFFSKEFINKRYSNNVFVDRLYTTIMNRKADASGRSYWINRLNRGIPRMTMFNQFASSQEFRNICAKYGIAY